MHIKKSFLGFWAMLSLFAILFMFSASAFIFFAVGRNFGKDTAATYTNNNLPTVIIDAGHGGEDGGTVGCDGSKEKDINLKIAKKLQNHLDAIGIPSLLTRSEDILLYDRNTDFLGHKKVLDMAARRKIVESHGNAIFISIHQNSFPEPKYSGFQIYYSQNNSSSKVLCNTIEGSIKSLLQPNNARKAKPSAGNIYLLEKLSCPAVLLECGFMSNPTECALLNSEVYQNKLCAVLCSSIVDYLSQYR